MLKILIFVCFVILISSNESEFLKIIEDNIDDTVDPCDDFYRHSCAKFKPENETMYILFKNKFRDIVNSYDLPEELKFAENLTANDSTLFFLVDILSNRNQTNNIAKVANDFHESCVNKNKTTMKLILHQITSQFSNMHFMNLIFDQNCERASGKLGTNLQEAWNEKIKNGEKSFSYAIALINNLKSNIWYSNNSHLVDIHRELFEEFKSEVIRLINNTHWMKSTDTTEAFERLTKQMNFTNCIKNSEEDVKRLLELNNSLAICRSNYSIESLRFLCYLNMNATYTDHMRSLEAYNDHPKVCFHHALLNVVQDVSSPGLFYGSSGSIMGHELGHTFVKSYKDHLFVPDSPPHFQQCVQKQFENTCSFYKEKKCETTDKQFDENGSDIFGQRLAFDMMKKKHGHKTHEIVPGSKYNLTNAELFFYVSSNLYCNRDESTTHDKYPHHAKNARVNAGVVQVPDFQRIFICDKDTRMMRSRTVGSRHLMKNIELCRNNVICLESKRTIDVLTI